MASLLSTLRRVQPCPRPEKRGYSTSAEAERGLARVRAKYGPTRQMPYECVCGRWHLGHDEREWERRKRARYSRRRDGMEAHHWARPAWFIPIEGVIAPSAFADGMSALEMSGTVFHYWPDIVARLGLLHRQGVVELRWLTTHPRRAVRAWQESGLRELPFRRVLEGRRRSWQSNTVEAWLDASPGRRAIWVDPSLTRSRLRGFDRARLLAAGIDAQVGLTFDHLDHAEAWASET